MDILSVKEKLIENELFRNSNISNSDFDDLKLNIVNLKKGEILFHQGVPVNSIYLIIEGEINLIKKQTFGKTHSLLSKNNFFGHEEYFLQTNRNSIAIAFKDSCIVELLRENIDIILSCHSSILNNIKNSVLDLDSASITKFENIIDELPDSTEKLLSIFPMELKTKNDATDSTKDKLYITDSNMLGYNKIDLNKIESGINKIINDINENLSQLKEEKNKILTAASDYENYNKKLLDEIKNLKEQERRFISIEKEKNEILVSQSYKIIELEKETIKLNELESGYSKEIELLAEQEAKDKIRIKKLEVDFKEKETIISKLENDLKEEQTIISKLENDLKENKTVISKFENDLKENETIVSKLENDLKENETKISKLENDSKEKETIISKLENNLKEEEQLISKLRNDLKEKEATISKLDNDSKENLKTISDLNKTSLMLTQETNDQDRIIKEQKAELENSERKVESIRSELTTKERSLIELNKDLLNKSLIISQKDESLNKEKAEIEKLLTSLEEKNETIQNLSAKIGELQNQLDNQNESEKNNTECMLNQSRKIAEYEESLTNYKKELSKKEETLINFIQEIGELSENVWQKQIDINEQNKIIIELQDEIVALKKSSDDFIKKEYDSNSIICDLKSQLLKVNSELNLLSEEVKGKSRLIEIKEQENLKLDSQVSDNQKNINDLKNALEKKDEKINDLENLISKLKNEISESQKLDEDFNSLKTELTIKNNAYKELKNENDNLSEQIKNLKLQNQENKNEHNTLLKVSDELNKFKSDVETYKNTIKEKDIIIEKIKEQFENIRLTKSALIKTLTSAKSNYEEEIKKKDNRVTELLGKLEEMQKTLEEKVFLENQQVETIESQAEKIARLEVFVNECKEKSGDKVIIKEGSIINDDSPNADSGEQAQSNDNKEIFSRCKLIASESVNSYTTDRSFELFQYSNIHIVNVNIIRATMDVASIFNKFLTKIINKERNKIVVNLSDCGYIDSSILGVLVNNLKKTTILEGDLRIVWGGQKEYSMFSLTKLDNIFQIFQNLRDAIDSFS